MSLEDCLGAATECNAPMVSICGGEPLIYPHIEALVDGLLAQRRIVYICTNAMFMRKKMREWMAAQMSTRPDFVEGKISALLGAGLLTEKDATEIRKGSKDPAKPTIGPTKWMYWNVHLDGLERTHDLIVEREGVFKECILAIKMAKLLGYQVATNATIYKETDMQEIEQMFDYLSDLGVDGHTITPGYDYDAAKKDMAYLNENYLKFQAGYLFPEVARRLREFCEANPEAAKRLIRCGIGDVTEPLPRAAIDAMKQAVEELGHRETFRGYGPEHGYEFLRSAIARHDYRDRNIDMLQVSC